MVTVHCMHEEDLPAMSCTYALKCQYKARQRHKRGAVGNLTAPTERAREGSLHEVLALLLRNGFLVPPTPSDGVSIDRSEDAFSFFEYQ